MNEQNTNTREQNTQEQNTTNMNMAILSKVEQAALKAASLLDAVLSDPSVDLDKKSRLARDMLETYTKLFRVQVIHEEKAELSAATPLTEDSPAPVFQSGVMPQAPAAPVVTVAPVFKLV